MAMDLDALKIVWAEHDRKLDETLRLNRALLRGRMAGGARSALAWLGAGMVLEAAIDAIGVVALGLFLAANVATPRFLVPGIVLDVFAIAALAAAIGQAFAAFGLDFGRPVAEIQAALESLRIVRLRTVGWTLLVSPLLWTPLSIVALRGLFGIDAYAVFGSAYIWASLAFGAAVLGFGLWFVKTFGSRLKLNRVVAFLVRTLEGSELRKAFAAIEALREFERE